VIEPFTVLAEDDDLPAWEMPAEIERLYGRLGLADECLVANFVESLDGVVAIPGLPRSHALVSDDSAADRFVLALLRACADVVLVGAGTLAASPTGTWRVDKAYPEAADTFAELRAARGLAAQPRVAIVTSGTSFSPSHPVLEADAIVLTTESAAAGVAETAPEATEVVAVNGGAKVDLRAAVGALHERGHRVIVSEAGPTLFGQLVDASLVDELFLTVSPLLAGRALASRLSLVEGVELLPDRRVSGRLRSVRANGSHLFLRYALDELEA
jgi:riboflavin biosynthesis pyrimidine reductase